MDSFAITVRIGTSFYHFNKSYKGFGEILDQLLLDESEYAKKFEIVEIRKEAK